MSAISARTAGFVGADLAALVREAGLLAITQTLLRSKQADAAAGGTDHQPLLPITLSHMEAALLKVRPSALREITLEVPRVTWEDVGGQDAIKERLREAVEWPVVHADALARLGVRASRGILLYGPPGCSKTLLARALATQAGCPFVAIKGPELLSKWVGESERAVQELFRKARAASPAIVFFDEIDALAGHRGAEGGTMDRVVSQLLAEMDGVAANAGPQVVVIAATNRPDLLDRALLRPGRFDRLLYVGPPDTPSRAQILRIHLRKTPHSLSNDDFRLLAERTEHYTGAELAQVCREASLAALRVSMETAQVTLELCLQALEQVKPRIAPETLEFYSRFQVRNTCST